MRQETSARVSIFQRLIPSVSFGVTAISGLLGAWWLLDLFKTLKDDKNATIKGLMNSLGSIEQSVAMMLVLAAVIGAISVVVVFMRSDEDEATMPGGAYLAGLPCLISPALTSYMMFLVIDAFHTPAKMGFEKLGGDVAEYALASIGAAGFSLLLLSAFVLLPFRARIVKRISPAIAVALITLCITTLVVISFWLVGYSQQPTPPFPTA